MWQRASVGRQWIYRHGYLQHNNSTRRGMRTALEASTSAHAGNSPLGQALHHFTSIVLALVSAGLDPPTSSCVLKSPLLVFAFGYTCNAS